MRASLEINFVPVLKQIKLPSHLCYIPLPTALFDSVMCVFRAQNNKVMICTYWWWLSVTGERQTEQDNLLEPARSVQWTVSRKTQKYSNNRHCVKPVQTSFWCSSRTLGQCQVTRRVFSTGFHWRYVSSNAGNLRLPELSDSLRAGRAGFESPWGEIFRTPPDGPWCPPNLQ